MVCFKVFLFFRLPLGFITTLYLFPTTYKMYDKWRNYNKIYVAASERRDETRAYKRLQ